MSIIEQSAFHKREANAHTRYVLSQPGNTSSEQEWCLLAANAHTRYVLSQPLLLQRRLLVSLLVPLARGSSVLVLLRSPFLPVFHHVASGSARILREAPLVI